MVEKSTKKESVKKKEKPKKKEKSVFHKKSDAGKGEIIDDILLIIYDIVNKVLPHCSHFIVSALETSREDCEFILFILTSHILYYLLLKTLFHLVLYHIQKYSKHSLFLMHKLILYN